MSFADSINTNNWIVNAFITVTPFTEFEYGDGNRVDFKGDSLTGAKVAGSYWYDHNGTAYAYGFLSSIEASDFVYFAQILLNGDFDAFYNHASTLYSESYNPLIVNELSYAAATGYGQNIAEWMDTLPGALGFSDDSTTVSFNGEEFYYA